MNAGTWFWLIYVIAGIAGVVFGVRTGNRVGIGVGFVLYILVGLIGWSQFGPPLR